MDGYFVDAKIGDLDGNGIPDLIIVMNLSRFGTNATPHVFVAVYSWEEDSFSELPSVTLDIGKQADIILIDPKVLKSRDCNETRRLEYRELFDHKQMVNRPEGIVTQVLINGHTVWVDGMFTDVLGAKPLGRALRAA